jgi:hypothetical protein
MRRNNYRKERKKIERKRNGRFASLRDFMRHQDNVIDEKNNNSVETHCVRDSVICPKCGKQDKVILRGVRKTTLRGAVQRYGCKRCNHRFLNEPFIHTWFPDWVYEKVLEESVNGLRDFQIAKSVNSEAKRRNEDFSISPRTVLNIKMRAVKIIGEFELRARRREKSATWQIDDTPQPYSKKKKNDQIENSDGVSLKKRKKNFAWITSIFEEEGRYCLSQVTSEDRTACNSEKAMRLALIRAGYGPQLVKCDGYKGHVKGVRAVLRLVEIDSQPKKKNFAHINRIERYHRTLRSLALKKKRHFRSIKALDVSAELSRQYYNFMRPHASLNGMPPAKIAGIEYPYHEGLTWLEFIRFAFFFLRRHRCSI